MISGIIVTGVSYTIATGVGSIMLEDEGCAKCDEMGASLYVPVVGPFVAAGLANEGVAPLIYLGMIQLTGVGLLVGGVIKYRRSLARAREEGFLVFEPGKGKTLSFEVASGPRLAGLGANLRF